MPSMLKEQVETPALLIDLDRLESNIRVMSEFMKDKKPRLRPHFKTSKCPIISQMEIAAGAKGVTCAKVSEAEVCVQAGIKDVLIANQIVDQVKIARLCGLAHKAKITVLADNPANIDALSEAAVAAGVTVYVLVELDVGMKRCGVTTAEEVDELARKITQSKGLVFEGIQAYEGHLGHISERGRREQGVKEMVQKVSWAKELLESKGITVNQVSGGGTGTFDITGNSFWTEIQAGSYVFMDTAYNQLGLRFENALTVLATVIHKRQGVAITDAGLKVCPTDQGLPAIKDHPGLGIELNEEHGIIADSQDELSYLQKVEYIPGHCCTTVNVHDHYHCIRDGILEVVWPILGRGKSQ
jgi:D-serine deaminase-like pyridoxal phosphate-dependent protein